MYVLRSFLRILTKLKVWKNIYFHKSVWLLLFFIEENIRFLNKNTVILSYYLKHKFKCCLPKFIETCLKKPIWDSKESKISLCVSSKNNVNCTVTACQAFAIMSQTSSLGDRSCLKKPIWDSKHFVPVHTDMAYLP